MILLKSGFVLNGKDELQRKDILVENGRIARIDDDIEIDGIETYYLDGCWVIPGAIDVHAHLREPGYEEKETIKSGTMAAAKGGITTVMAMANLNPVPDCLENLKIEQEIIDRDAVVHVYPYASVTKGQLGKEVVKICKLKKYVKAFSDDGVGFNDSDVFTDAVKKARRNDAIICSHAEAQGYGENIRSEVDAVFRELEIVKREGGCRYHFCHLSTIQAFDFVKKARDEGFDVTCEVTPHHLTFDDSYIKQGPNFKMNPPLRPRQHRDATIEALKSGIATIIATDHAPHTPDEKNRPYEHALNGVVGFESLLPVVYSNLVKTGIASHRDMLDWCVFNPAKRFRLPYSEIKVGSVADIAAIDIENESVLEEKNIVSKGKSSPFTGRKVYGLNQLTLVDGKVVFSRRGGARWR